MKRKLIVVLTVILCLLLTPVSAFGYTHNSKFNDCVVVNGIDVSEWQSNIDWQKVKASGVDFAIIRIGGRGYGTKGTLYYDTKYANNIKKAKEAGVMVGVYYFSQAITENEAVEEAKHAVTLLKGEKLNLPVFMDYEFVSDPTGRLNKAKLSKAKATAIAKKFCDTVKSYGYDAGIYANLTFLNKTIDGATLGKSYPIWVAQYYDVCQYGHDYQMWQYSSSGKVNGISGKADVDFWYIDKEPAAASGKSLANCSVSMMGGNICQYNGGKIVEPQVIVKDGSYVLQKGTDYEVGYINNMKKGTAYAYIKGEGKYSGYKLAPFEISDALPPDVKLVPETMIEATAYNFDNYIAGAALETDVNTFKSNLTLKEGYTYKVFDANGAEVVSGFVGTGMTVVVYDASNEEVAHQTIVIRGDSNGDGKCNVSDLVNARKVIAEISNLFAPYYEATDANKDGIVSVKDLITLRKHIAEIELIKN